MHLRLDLGTFLSRFILVKSARNNDAHEAAVCIDVAAGEIVVFDKAHVDSVHLHALAMREVFRVSRGKENMQYEVGRVVNLRTVQGQVGHRGFLQGAQADPATG